MAIDSLTAKELMVPRASQGLLQQGLNGIKQSQSEMVKSAGEIVKAGTSAAQDGKLPEIAESLVDMKRQQHIFNASAKVVKVADNALGSLLDVRA